MAEIIKTGKFKLTLANGLVPYITSISITMLITRCHVSSKLWVKSRPQLQDDDDDEFLCKCQMINETGFIYPVN